MSPFVVGVVLALGACDATGHIHNLHLQTSTAIAADPEANPLLKSDGGTGQSAFHAASLQTHSHRPKPVYPYEKTYRPDEHHDDHHYEHPDEHNHEHQRLEGPSVEAEKAEVDETKLINDEHHYEHHDEHHDGPFMEWVHPELIKLAKITLFWLGVLGMFVSLVVLVMIRKAGSLDLVQIPPPDAEQDAERNEAEVAGKYKHFPLSHISYFEAKFIYYTSVTFVVMGLDVVGGKVGPCKAFPFMLSPNVCPYFCMAIVDNIIPIFGFIYRLLKIEQINDGKLHFRNRADPAHRFPLETTGAKPSAQYTFKAKCVFEHVSENSTRVWIIFIAQCVLFTLYFHHLEARLAKEAEEEEEGNLNFTKIWYFLIAMVAIQSAAFIARKDAGAGFGEGLWAELIGNNRIELVSQEVDDMEKGVSHDNVGNMSRMKWIRLFQTLLVNGFFRSFIIITTPTFLSAADSEIDFVKDALALTFLTTLDDIDDKEYRLTNEGDEIQQNQ